MLDWFGAGCVGIIGKRKVDVGRLDFVDGQRSENKLSGAGISIIVCVYHETMLTERLVAEV